VPAYTFRFDIVWEYFGYLLSGVQITLLVTAGALASGLVVGLGIGLARLSRRRWLQALGAGYVEVFRNTPALIQLMWVYYCLPIVTGINLDALLSATLALALNGSAYIAEIIRAGVQSVDRGQVEAARTLGLSYGQTMRRVVLPQAFKQMIPPFVNETVSLLKFSSLVSVLGVADLTYQAQVVSTTTFRPLEIFTFIAVVYFVLCTLLSYLARRLELRLSVSE
jgi:His/Glu/Gln/Arg/opine family amino acid ABC transporter permease subunit